MHWKQKLRKTEDGTGLADLSPVVGVGVDAFEVDAVELCVGLVEEGAIVEEVVDI